MGTALAAAIGVAEKRPARDVIALLGDGEALMGAGSFWSLAGIAPANLLAVVLIDGHYTITGGQPLGVPDVFGAVAAALGLATATARPTRRSPSRVATLAAARRCSRSATTSAPGRGRRRSSTRRSCAGASSKRRRSDRRRQPGGLWRISRITPACSAVSKYVKPLPFVRRPRISG